MTMLTSTTIPEFLDKVASQSPAPGGGSVSAFAGSLGAALTSMVCRLTIGKKKYADVQPEMERILNQSEELRKKLTAMVDEDATAFGKVMDALALPKETDEQKNLRSTAIQDATKAATLVPLKLLELCEEGAALAQTVAEKGNRNSLSDAGVSLLLFQAAARGAALNVRINLGGIEDRIFRDESLDMATIVINRIDSMMADYMPSLTARL
jgi:methenyltetrahydrofolate cyclohydrolase